MSYSARLLEVGTTRTFQLLASSQVRSAAKRWLVQFGCAAKQICCVHSHAMYCCNMRYCAP